MSSIKKIFENSLPDYIHTLPEKNKPAVWLPKERAIEHERMRCYKNDRHFLMTDYDNDGKKQDHTLYDLEPNFIIYNPINFNHQAYWLISQPVFCQESQKQAKPYKLLRAIESAFDAKYECDPRFARYISRNPLFRSVETDWRHDRAHKLAELAEVVDLNQKRIITSGTRVFESGKPARNCTTFDELRFWAYKQDTTDISYELWVQRCLTKALQTNSTFADTMDLNEVTSIAKSVAQYTYNKEQSSFGKTFEQYVSDTHTSEIQAKRGRRSAQKRWKDHEKQTPWVDLGISRATYYRDKRK